MLSLFPDLLNFWFLGITMIRIAVGVVFIYLAYQKLFHYKQDNDEDSPGIPFMHFLGSIEFFGGILLLFGFLTQLASVALCLAALSNILLRVKYRNNFECSLPLYFLLFVFALSFLFFGAGAFAIDYPI